MWGLDREQVVRYGHIRSRRQVTAGVTPPITSIYVAVAYHKSPNNEGVSMLTRSTKSTSTYLFCVPIPGRRGSLPPNLGKHSAKILKSIDHE